MAVPKEAMIAWKATAMMFVVLSGLLSLRPFMDTIWHSLKTKKMERALEGGLGHILRILVQLIGFITIILLVGVFRRWTITGDELQQAAVAWFFNNRSWWKLLLGNVEHFVGFWVFCAFLAKPWATAPRILSPGFIRDRAILYGLGIAVCGMAIAEATGFAPTGFPFIMGTTFLFTGLLVGISEQLSRLLVIRLGDKHAPYILSVLCLTIATAIQLFALP